MGLLAVPPVPAGPPALGPVLVGSTRIGDGTCMAKGMIFAATNTGSQEKIFRWRNPYDPATYDTLSPASIFFISCNSIVYDSLNDFVYAGVYNFNVGAGSNQLTVVKTNPTAFTDGGTPILSLSIGTASFGDLGINSSIATDGTYVYGVANDLSQNSWVGKAQLNNTLAASIQLPNPTAGNAKAGSVILLGGDGFVYVAGGASFSGNLWVARIDTATLASVTTLNIGGVSLNDDYVLDANYLWLGDESASIPGTIYRVNRDLSGFTTIKTGIEGWIDCLLADPDGQRIWIVQNQLSGTGSPSALFAIDKTGAVVTPIYRTSLLASDGTDLNELFKITDGAFFGITFNVLSGSLPSRAGVIPIFTDPGLTAKPMVGRGAAW